MKETPEELSGYIYEGESTKQMIRTGLVVTFDANGGTCGVETRAVAIGGTLSDLPEPTYRYHVFEGWYTAASDGEKVTESTVFEKGTKVYAQWTREPGYTITFDARQGTCSTTEMRTDASGNLDSLPSATRSGFCFTGWYTEASGGDEIDGSTIFQKDTTVYAQWVQEYTVTFDANGGECSAASAVTVGGKLSGLPVPFHKYHVFQGWYSSASGGEKVTDSTVFTQDSVIYAQWTEEPGFTILFDAQQGTCSTAEMRTDADGRLASLPSATRDGFRFTGWYTEASGGDEVGVSHVFAAGTTVYAQWKQEPVVTFDANGGACTVGSMRTADGRLSGLPVPFHKYHDFQGWYDSASGGETVTEATVFVADTTIYAHWIQSTVTYDHGRLAAMSVPISDIVLDGGMVITEGATYQKLPDTAGYSHVGWIVGGQQVGPTAVITDTSSHTAESVWAEIGSFVPIPDAQDYLPTVTDDTVGGGRDPPDATAAIAVGCVAALLAIIVLAVHRPER